MLYIKLFSQNGDYARNIPEQYTSSGANTLYCRLPKQKNNMYKIPKNDLCGHCNKQESLKLIELSNFEPRNRKLYNDELKAFKEYLEEKYPLCTNCKLTVYDVLHKQTLWLAAYKMLFFRKKPVQMLIKVSIYLIKKIQNLYNYYILKYFLSCNEFNNVFRMQEKLK